MSKVLSDQLTSLEQRQDARIDVVSTTVKNNKEEVVKQITDLATSASTALQALEDQLESDYKKLIAEAKEVACQYAKTEDESLRKDLNAVEQSSKKHADKLAAHTVAIDNAAKALTDLDTAYLALNQSVETLSTTHAEEISDILQTISDLQTAVSSLQEADDDQIESILSITNDLSARVDNVSSKSNPNIPYKYLAISIISFISEPI